MKERKKILEIHSEYLRNEGIAAVLEKLYEANKDEGKYVQLKEKTGKTIKKISEEKKFTVKDITNIVMALKMEAKSYDYYQEPLNTFVAPIALGIILIMVDQMLSVLNCISWPLLVIGVFLLLAIVGFIFYEIDKMAKNHMRFKRESIRIQNFLEICQDECLNLQEGMENDRKGISNYNN